MRTNAGNKVGVEHGPDKPHIHRMEGMTNTLEDEWFLAPLIGAIVWIACNFLNKDLPHIKSRKTCS